MRRKMTYDPRCLCCRDETEDLDYLFRTCRDARLIWNKLLNKDAKIWCMGLPFPEWIDGTSSWTSQMKRGPGKNCLSYAFGGSGGGGTTKSSTLNSWIQEESLQW